MNRFWKIVIPFGVLLVVQLFCIFALRIRLGAIPMVLILLGVNALLKDK